MLNELYRVIKTIEGEKLTPDDLEDLLHVFIVTENTLVRIHIALIFSELHFNKAIPHLNDKINDKKLYNNNGTLVFALGELDPISCFLNLITIIGEQAYEARITAYTAVSDVVGSISFTKRNEAMDILKSYQIQANKMDDKKEPGSRLDFIVSTIELLKSCDHKAENLNM